MTVELVSAFAGDREMTPHEHALIDLHEKQRSKVFYSDLIYAVSHHYFAPEVAEAIWGKVLAHKRLMSELLGRNVRITVATLDYLSNITNDLEAQTLISETRVSELANLSMRDGMTGLFNHSTCNELLELQCKAYRRYGIGVALLLLDIDDFKWVNDHHGHQEGDRVLVDVANALLQEARESDVACRLGGDEFVVILCMTNNAEEANDIARRIRARIASVGCHGRPITVSLGIALCDTATASAHALVERADHALYEAKARGKDQVVLAPMA